MLKITSPESLDAAVADCVKLKLELTSLKAAVAARQTDIEKRYAGEICELTHDVAEAESRIRDYCLANRGTLFLDKKSRHSLSAEIGFELTPWRVERAGKKITWKEVVRRLLALTWGQLYIRHPEPEVNKEALLSDREKLSETDQATLAIRFARDEQFFIRPVADQAEPTTTPA